MLRLKIFVEMFVVEVEVGNGCVGVCTARTSLSGDSGAIPSYRLRQPDKRLAKLDLKTHNVSTTSKHFHAG